MVGHSVYNFMSAKYYDLLSQNVCSFFFFVFPFGQKIKSKKMEYDHANYN